MKIYKLKLFQILFNTIKMCTLIINHAAVQIWTIFSSKDHTSFGGLRDILSVAFVVIWPIMTYYQINVFTVYLYLNNHYLVILLLMFALHWHFNEYILMKHLTFELLNLIDILFTI